MDLPGLAGGPTPVVAPPPWRILMLKNRYLQPGGEEQSVAAEARMLRAAGHHLDLVEYDNLDIARVGAPRAGLRAIWSRSAVRDVRARLAAGRYHLLHVQNHFPLISPAVLRVAAGCGAATVQSLRNYRLVCANAQNFRAGRTCHACDGLRAPWGGVRHGCYRASRLASVAPVAMVALHRAIGTWRCHTHAFIAVSAFVRQRYLSAGFPAARLHARANLVEDRLPGPEPREAVAVHAGRLSPEKGVDTLIAAWRRAAPPGTLMLVGDGPDRARLEGMAAADSSIRFMGHLPPATVAAVLGRARVAVVASLWEEPFGRAVVEAFAAGTPVLASDCGGMTAMLADGLGGALFPVGDATALAARLGEYLGDPVRAAAAGRAARAKFDADYAPARMLSETETIYRSALAAARP